MRRNLTHRLALVVLAGLISTSLVMANARAPLPAAQKPLSGTKLVLQVVSSTGGDGSSGTHKLSTTMGQTAAGSGTSGVHKLNDGYQQNFSTATCKCGDADGSGAIDISDAVFQIAYIFAGGPAPNPLCHGDSDGSGSIDISDAVFLILHAGDTLTRWVLVQPLQQRREESRAWSGSR